jgi:hypothetical protein
VLAAHELNDDQPRARAPDFVDHDSRTGSVSGEDRAAWFGDRDDECIDGGAGAGESAKLGGRRPR